MARRSQNLRQLHCSILHGSCESKVVSDADRKENNVLEGDPMFCADYMEIPKGLPGPGRNESNEMMYEYGAREGVPRLLDIFNRFVGPCRYS